MTSVVSLGLVRMGRSGSGFASRGDAARLRRATSQPRPAAFDRAGKP